MTEYEVIQKVVAKAVDRVRSPGRCSCWPECFGKYLESELVTLVKQVADMPDDKGVPQGAKMKSRLAIQCELGRVERSIRGHHPGKNGSGLAGAQQALAWVLGQPAMAPNRCFCGTHRSPKQSS